MKRIGNLFKDCFTEQKLLEAFYVAKKNKANKSSCLAFEFNLGSEIESLALLIKTGKYKPDPLKTFIVHEPKERVIHAPSFKDLVVQHAIYKVIYPIFDKTFIDQSFACRKGKGTHSASSYTQKVMRKHSGELYYAKLDIRKFFYSIDKEILKKQMQKKIKDEAFIEMMCLFLGDKGGIPIGNLLSQIYALIYLNDLDHFVKRELKVKHYVRYVDDFVAIGLTLDEAKIFKIKCEDFVRKNLNLELSHWCIQKIKKGINFVGYRTWRRVKFVRKHSIIKFKKAVKTGDKKAISSLIGHASHSSSISFYIKYLQENNKLNLLTRKETIKWQSYINTPR